MQLVENGMVMNVSSPANEIVYVLKGNLVLISQSGNSYTVPSNCMFFLPKGINTSAYCFGEDAELMVIRFYDGIRFCNSNRIEDLQRGINLPDRVEKISLPEYFILKVDDIVKNYIEMLALCYKVDLRCAHYYKNMTKEFLHLLYMRYSKETLYYFFRPVVSSDFNFTQRVLDKVDMCKSVSQLASEMNCSVSSFEKKFYQVFGESPYRWMKKRRVQEIHRLICMGEMSCKAISDRFDFPSMSQFYRFVKHELGQTPKEIKVGKF
jgi:AraC-like DNA-binding protein